ncbi:MAG: hypothetical protein ACFE9R_03505 [Candidatus Hermodarchaeota archaeon]
MSQNLIDIEITGHQITISGAISLKLLVSDEFNYIGNQEILIYDISKVFNYVFATYTNNERQGQIISKLLFLQYEYYLPDFEQPYNYKSTDIIELGGIVWQRDNFLFRSTYDDWNPKSDGYQLMTFLEKKDLKHPEWVWNNRLVTMLNDEKTQELLIIYLEEIPLDRLKLFVSNDKIREDQWQQEKVNLRVRSLSTFSVL